LRYDQRHTITAVAEWRLGRKWQIDARFQAGSGFPYQKTVYTVEVVEDANRNGQLDVYEDRNLNGRPARPRRRSQRQWQIGSHRSSDRPAG
jgi:hypothetical protein